MMKLFKKDREKQVCNVKFNNKIINIYKKTIKMGLTNHHKKL